MSEKVYPPDGDDYGNSIDVLVRIRGSEMPYVGYYTGAEWLVYNVWGITEVIEWWPLPEPGTGNKV